MKIKTYTSVFQIFSQYFVIRFKRCITNLWKISCWFLPQNLRTWITWIVISIKGLKHSKNSRNSKHLEESPNYLSKHLKQSPVSNKIDPRQLHYEIMANFPAVFLNARLLMTSFCLSSHLYKTTPCWVFPTLVFTVQTNCYRNKQTSRKKFRVSMNENWKSWAWRLAFLCG